jgi:adenylate cyclase
MAGEIGVIKKDIIYSGDVLNTAARIQAECNHFNADFLISGVTFNLFHQSDQEQFECIELGKLELRGRKELVSVNSIIKK